MGMNAYTPDHWVILELTPAGKETWYRLFAGWYGGYLGSDSWRVNSGITKLIDKEDHYEVYGHSGSCYKCYKSAEGTSGYMESILAGFQKDAEGKATIEIVPVTSVIDVLK